MSDVNNQIKKEFGTLKSNFLVLLNVNAENYFEAVMKSASIMSKRKKGVYVTVTRPCRFILKEMKKRNINTDNILFLDCISAMAGESGNEFFTCIENPAAIEEISMHINSLLNKIESDEKFLLIDSLSTLLIYNSIDSVKEFSMFLTNMLRLKGVDGILVIIEKEAPEDLKQILIAMCDKVIHV